MKVHFFPGKDKSSATARFRAYLVVDELRKRGIDAVLHSPPAWRPAWRMSWERVSELFRHIRIFSSVGRGDLVYLVRTVFQIDFFLLVVFFHLFRGMRFVFDFDDAIYLKPFGRRRSRFFTKNAAAVVVANRHIASWAKRYNQKVLIIPTCVPYEIYEKFSRERRQENKVFTIGWVGNGVNHYKSLKLLVPVFERLIADRVRFRFVLIGALGYKKLYDLLQGMQGLDIMLVDELEWSDPENVPREIQKFDVGVMPLVADSKTSGKSALKAIEYMAVGVPVIISPVGENQFLVQDGRDGFLAGDTRDWVEKIKQLASDKKLAEEMGRAGQIKIKKQYSYEAGIPKLIKLFDEIRQM